jgi:hypothetical protein
MCNVMHGNATCNVINGNDMIGFKTLTAQTLFPDDMR